jgi:tetratricopeptide (TPR) repeat protein
MKLKIKYNKPKRSFYLLLMLFLPLFSWADTAAEALFKKGNEQYAKAQYQQAAQTYQRVLKSGFTSAALYFNLGNAYYKTEDLPSAVLYYEKAHKLAPADQDININIQFCNLKLADKIEQQPEFFVSRWWHSLILIVSADQFAVLSVVLLLAGFILLIVYLFANLVAVKKASFYTGLGTIFIGLICIFLANQQVNYFETHHQAIIFSSSVTVKGSPNSNGKPLFVMHEGTKVAIVQQNGNWIEIELPNGNAGWITTQDVKDI